MSAERRRILDMVAQGKISAAEAEELLEAVGQGETVPAAAEGGAVGVSRPAKKFLRVLVEDGEDKVNIRVPLSLLRAGIRLTNLLPEQARGQIERVMAEKGLPGDLANIKPERVEDLIEQLGELAVDVNDGGRESVRIFCE
jgi:hypothetical protein